MSTPIEDATNEQLNEAAAQAQGWIDYPSDSVEEGKYWHFNANPLGSKILKSSYAPATNAHQAMAFVREHDIGVRSYDRGERFIAEIAGSDRRVMSDTPERALTMAFIVKSAE